MEEKKRIKKRTWWHVYIAIWGIFVLIFLISISLASHPSEWLRIPRFLYNGHFYYLFNIFFFALCMIFIIFSIVALIKYRLHRTAMAILLGIFILLFFIMHGSIGYVGGCDFFGCHDWANMCQMPVGIGCVDFLAKPDLVTITLLNHLESDIDYFRIDVSGDMKDKMNDFTTVAAEGDGMEFTVFQNGSIESVQGTTARNGKKIITMNAYSNNVWTGLLSNEYQITYRKAGNTLYTIGYGKCTLRTRE